MTMLKIDKVVLMTYIIKYTVISGKKSKYSSRAL